jgi:uncharacterized protein YwqG
MRMVRPAVDIVTRKGPRGGVGSSRFGGQPDLPPDFQWPSSCLPFRFVAQFCLADVPSTEPTPLPSSGVLSFFVADYDEEELFWGDPGYVRVFHFSDIESLAPAIGGATSPTVREVSFVETIDIPFDRDQMPHIKLEATEKEQYVAIRQALHQSCDYFLGYPSHRTLAYNPSPGDDWLSLVNLDSDEELDWCWHDGDRLMTFIHRSKLTEGNFEDVRSDAG